MQFLKAGSTVIVTGRREEKLKEVVQQHPGLHYIVSDASGGSLLHLMERAGCSTRIGMLLSRTLHIVSSIMEAMASVHVSCRCEE